MDVRDNLIGQTFGELTVLAFVSATQRSTLWLVECSCGATLRATTSRLRRRRRLACDNCYQKGAHVRRDIRLGVQSVSSGAAVRYRLAKKRAERRGWPFTLTLEEYAAISRQPCTYCGFHAGPVSVDRVNSALGYTRENCQPLCRRCNQLSSSMLKEIFLAHVRRIYEHTSIKS